MSSEWEKRAQETQRTNNKKCLYIFVFFVGSVFFFSSFKLTKVKVVAIRGGACVRAYGCTWECACICMRACMYSNSALSRLVACKTENGRIIRFSECEVFLCTQRTHTHTHSKSVRVGCVPPYYRYYLILSSLFLHFWIFFFSCVCFFVFVVTAAAPLSSPSPYVVAERFRL